MKVNIPFDVQYPLLKKLGAQYTYECGGVKMPGPYAVVGMALAMDHYKIVHMPTMTITNDVSGAYLREIVAEPLDHSSRPAWPQTWMDVAKVLSRRSPDPRLKVAAIVVPEDNTGILAQGFNGGPKGLYNKPVSMEPGKSGFIHAEANCLIKCPYHFPLKKHMYVTHSPCPECCRLIVNAGISRVVYDVPYRDQSGIEMLKEAGLDVMTLEEALK